ncbi:unnamed protein product [Ilex paraguariensis]|uniref:Uncharacterized protein n=1 Tax=Ilex paraguariensis TaxID=185542 RepID=A0ABC8T8B5_9AQUA
MLCINKQFRDSSHGYVPCFLPLYTNFTTPIVSTKAIPRPIGFTLSSPLPFPTHPLAEAEPFRLKQPPSLTTTRALKEWQEYEEAVKDKDLAQALRFLQDIPVEPHNSSIDSTLSRVGNGELGLFGLDKDWEVLDTCLNADDMRLVGSAYVFLKDRGLLQTFGKYRNIGIIFGIVLDILEGPRDVTPTVLKLSTGLEVTLKCLSSSSSSSLFFCGPISKLSPKKWGLSRSSRVVLVGLLAEVSFLRNQGTDIRPNLAATLGLAMIDSIFLGGSCLAQISSYWPPYKHRILVHEAGHLLIGLQIDISDHKLGTTLSILMGCPIRGVILDPIVAMQMGIQGQELSFGMRNCKMNLLKVDSVVLPLTGGLRLVYGEAEDGENDENLFRSVCVLLEPPLSMARMSNQARWSVLQSYNLLKWHKHAHRAAVKALESGGSLSRVIRRIEDAMSSGK